MTLFATLQLPEFAQPADETLMFTLFLLIDCEMTPALAESTLNAPDVTFQDPTWPDAPRTPAFTSAVSAT